jgi:hypothetical protein
MARQGRGVYGGNIDSRTETIDATGVLKLANANFFFLISATSNVALRFVRSPSAENFSGVQAGVQIARLERWDYLFITGAVGTVLQFFYGYSDVREDSTLFNQQIAVIAGVTAVAINPSAAFTDTVDTAQATNTQTNIAANLARRRITIGVPPSAAANEPVRVSGAGGAGRGVVIQPGTFQEFQTTAQLFVRNDNTLGTGLGTVWYAEEE